MAGRMCRNSTWKSMIRLPRNDGPGTIMSRLKQRTLPDAAIRHTVIKLPVAYQKFYDEWQSREGTPIHWVPSKVNWTRDPGTGAVSIVRDRPIPIVYPDQSHQGIWGGEGVIDGLVKKKKFRSPVPRFWVPALKRSVVYSEILDKYLSVVVTDRALQLIDQFNGFDSYLLENPAYEIKSLLALKLKKKILLALAMRDFAHDNPKHQLELLDKYKQFVLPIEEVEWYGLSVAEAKAKYMAQLNEEKVKAVQPLKIKLRQELIQNLRDEANKPIEDRPEPIQSTSWLSKLNPFSKPEQKSSL